MASEFFVVLIELLHLRVGQIPRPPDPGEDIVHAVAHGLACVGFGTTCPVADHLVMHAALQVLPVHGDVILQVSVGQEDIRLRTFDFLQQAGKIRRAQVEVLAEDDVEVPRVLLTPLLDAIAVINAMVGIFDGHSQLQPLVQLALVDEGSAGASRRS